MSPMTLTPGQRLGPYEIASRIGAGGMGEVWKARDTRLDRSVAIKILPPEFAQNAHLKARFEREAKTISQLNHPHICTLYDVGDDYLVMELIEGESLAERLEHGALPLPDVLKYGAQIADALDRAHCAGVVHRDLKPGNVMITRAGAKLLDFGLAKTAFDLVDDGATVHKPLTQEGTLLGTFQYMAPEQLETANVDARSDIFALGALLYEMATGRPAFEGKSKASLIAAIVKEQPPPMSEVQPLTPLSFEHVVAKCLAKDPEDRWQSARDVAQELRWIGESGSQVNVAAPLAARRTRRDRLAWSVAAIAGIAALAAGALAWRAMTRVESSPVMRFSAPNTIAARPGDTYGIIAVSPDGWEIIYAATVGTTKMLFRRAIDQFEAKPIPGTEGAVQPFFSPDGKWVGFFARHKLMKIALSGGQPTELAHAALPRGAEWLADDTIVFCPYFYGGIERVPASGGTATPVSKVDRAAGERSHRWPHALPGGRVVLYSLGLGSSWDNAKVVAQRLDTGERKVVLNGGCDARYVPTGHLVYVRGNSLYAVPFDAEALEVRGQPVEVLTGVANHTAGGAEFAFSRNGMLVYFSPGVGGDEGGQLIIVNRQGEQQPARLPAGAFTNPGFSPDGSAIVAVRDWNIWSIDTIRGTSTRVASGARVAWPVWSSDGSRIYYSSERFGWWQIFTRAADGSDEERQISKTDAPVVALAMSPDGREMLVRSDRKETAGDVDLMDLEGRIRPFARSEADELPGAFSPDGRWIAYSSDESGRAEIYVRPASGAAGRWQISIEGGIDPRWALPDEIAYLQGSRIMAVSVKTTPAFSAGTPRLLVDRNASDFDLTRDGRILIAEAPDAASPGRLNVVVNWFEELRLR
ncbi:MAG TPA: protein kinase [Thermoanaerobaculia bacterium]|nr:protein kinase [Thermoanaerobaculia bacterium]